MYIVIGPPWSPWLTQLKKATENFLVSKGSRQYIDKNHPLSFMVCKFLFVSIQLICHAIFAVLLQEHVYHFLQVIIGSLYLVTMTGSKDLCRLGSFNDVLRLLNSISTCTAVWKTLSSQSQLANSDQSYRWKIIVFCFFLKSMSLVITSVHSILAREVSPCQNASKEGLEALYKMCM